MGRLVAVDGTNKAFATIADERERFLAGHYVLTLSSAAPLPRCSPKRFQYREPRAERHDAGEQPNHLEDIHLPYPVVLNHLHHDYGFAES